MYRILYHTSDGRIETCRKISDSTLAQQLAMTPELASIDGFVPDKSVKKVNLETLQLEDIENTFNVLPLMDYIRLHRDKRLTLSDWTVGVDSPLSDSKKTEWQTYRQALRDLPSTTTATSIENIVWPTKPE